MTRPPPGLWAPSSQSSAPEGALGERAAVQPLQPCRPVDGGEASLDRRRRDREAAAPDGGDREPGIAELVPAGQARARQVEQPVLVLEDKPAALGKGDPVAVAGEDRGGEPGGVRLDHLHHLRDLRCHHRRAAALDDARLLAGDLAERVAEELFVVERDRRDRRDQRIVDDIGGVVAAAKPDLEQGEVGRMAREEEDRRRGGDLELRDRRAVVDALDLEERLDQRVLADEAAAAGAAEPDALMETDEMRRGVDMGRLPRRLDHGAEEGGGRSLAVGAGDVDDRRQAPLGMPEPRQEHAHAVEREVDLARIERLEALEDRAGMVHPGSPARPRPARAGPAAAPAPAPGRRAAGRCGRSSRAACGDARRGRSSRGRGDIPPAGSLPAASRGWSAR